jgi:hypothetical protein
MPNRTIGAVAIGAVTALLIVPSGAAAKAGDRSFTKTYPVASKLCQEVAAGKRKRLKTVAPSILEDCATLEAGFKTATTTVVTARTTLTAQIVADRALIHAACPPPAIGKPACDSVKATEKAAIAVLKAQRAAAIKLYYVTIEANRKTFWTDIHRIKGLTHLPTDKKIGAQPV